MSGEQSGPVLPEHVVRLSPSVPVSMGESWYEFATPDHFWMRWRTALLRRAMDRAGLRGGRGIDIGCGQGVLFRELEAQHAVTIDGCDLSAQALQSALPGRGVVYQYNIFDYHSDLVGRYDFGLLIDVIEHIDDDVSFLRAACRHLKPGGVLLLNVPALQPLFGPYDRAAGHLRRYSRQDLERVLREAGLAVEQVFYWGLTLIPLLVARNFVLRRTPEEEIIRRGFQPVHPVVNFTLGSLRELELRLGGKPPIGSSLIAVARVTGNG